MPCKSISLEAVATIGIDIGKNTFHLIRLDKMGAIVLRQKLSRNQVSASKQPAIERPRSRRRGVRARHHARGDRRDHRFGPLRGCAGAGSETMPERSHLSGLHGSGRHQVMQGRETRPTAGAAAGGGAAAGYLAVERCCVAAVSAAAPPCLPPRPVCLALAVGLSLL
jgi:hypothetical protein